MDANNGSGMLDVGFGNMVPKLRVIGIVAYDSDPVHRQCAELEKMHRVIDATKGRKVRSVVFLDSSHIVLSAIARETLWERFETPSALGKRPRFLDKAAESISSL